MKYRCRRCKKEYTIVGDIAKHIRFFHKRIFNYELYGYEILPAKKNR